MPSAESVASMEGQPSVKVNLFLKNPSATWIWEICVSLKKKKERKKILQDELKLTPVGLCSLQQTLFLTEGLSDREIADFSVEKLPKVCLTENH